MFHREKKGPDNIPIKLPACGSLTHGRHHWHPHAAPYRDRLGRHMKTNYPLRSPMPSWARYSCMALGIAVALGTIGGAFDGSETVTLILAGVCVGGAWFAFGFIGGLPLVDTVPDWEPSSTPSIVTEQQVQGLLTMRRRRLAMWLSFPAVMLAGPPALLVTSRIGERGLMVLLLGIPLAVLAGRYYLSRCPRCGYGFFARSRSRAALLFSSRTCGHCGLSLYAYKNRHGAAQHAH
jgi:hypothetical protein